MSWYADARSYVKFLDGVFVVPAPLNLECGQVNVQHSMDGSTESVAVIWLDVHIELCNEAPYHRFVGGVGTLREVAITKKQGAI